MAFGQNPGALFIGTLTPDDKAFVYSLLKAAKDDGYGKVIEPCSGGLAMSCLAAEAGFEDIEASDITMFSGILGRYVEGRGIEDMGIVRKSDGSRVTDPIDAMMEIKHAQLKEGADGVYGKAMLLDFEQKRGEIRNAVEQKMAEVKERIPHLKYRDMDMFDHIAEAADGEKCVILCMCPTYGGGYERFYRAVDEAFDWNRPRFDVFSPPEGYADLLSAVEGSDNLLIIYEEVPTGEHIGTPVYGRSAGRADMNMYLVADDCEEVDRLLGRGVARKSPAIAPMKYPIIPSGHVVTKGSEIAVVKAPGESIRYYRNLWTHNFTPNSCSVGYAFLVDGYLAGVFGYMNVSVVLNGHDTIPIAFGICAPTCQRLARLMYAVSMQRRTIAAAVEFDDISVSRARKVRTAMITRYPESKEMRGLMKLIERKRDGRCGYKLTYEADIQDKTYRRCLAEWLAKEEAWQRRRRKA